MNNVLILGNGFDLDLGLPTKYLDFAKSEYWPAATKIEIEEGSPKNENYTKLAYFPDLPKLDIYIENAKNRETWFDLEGELLKFSKVYDRSGGDYFGYDFSNETKERITQNVDYFNKLRNSLNDYIIKVQKNQAINKECTAMKVLKAVVGNGYFENIYSFNYTDLNSIARRIGIAQEIDYTHLHGKVSDKSIILGVDETKLRKGYESFHKSSSRFYRSHDLYNSLTTAREIVIFGLSFGSIDYSYFDRFFKQLSVGESIVDKKKQYITIFTKDDSSRFDIVTNMRNMGIDIQRLYAQTHFQIICTSDDVEKQELSEFYWRLKQSSKAKHNEKLKQLDSIAH